MRALDIHPHAIRAIFWKDLRDAIRDGRVLVAVLLPIGLGILYGQLFDDEVARPSAAAAYAAADATRLPDELRTVVGTGVDLELKAVDEAEVRRLVAAEEIDLGLVVPAGFDAAVARGESPPLGVLLPEGGGFDASFLRTALEEALRRLAGQGPPATIAPEAVPPLEEEELIFERLGPGPYFVITSAVFLIAMVSLYAVPIILAEETEKKTLDALTMIASGLDVVVAKALVGLAYGVVGVALLLGITRTLPAALPAFGLAMLLLGVALVGVGLLLGGLFLSATQLNTWGSLFLLPFVAPVYAVGLPVPDWADALLAVTPTGEGTRLAIDALTGERIFGAAGRAYLVLLVWIVAAYVLLLRRLARREG